MTPGRKSRTFARPPAQLKQDTSRGRKQLEALAFGSLQSRMKGADHADRIERPDESDHPAFDVSTVYSSEKQCLFRPRPRGVGMS